MSQVQSTAARGTKPFSHAAAAAARLSLNPEPPSTPSALRSPSAIEPSKTPPIDLSSTLSSSSSRPQLSIRTALVDPTPDPAFSSTVSVKAPRTAMISGHLDLPLSIFATHYHPLLAAAVDAGDSFVMGDARGVDFMALTWLLSRPVPGIKDRVAVYCVRADSARKMREKGVRVIFDSGATRGGTRQGGQRARQNLTDRDARMTEDSDYDILFVRSEEEARALYGARYRVRVSGTELNRLRRLEQDKRRAEGMGG